MNTLASNSVNYKGFTIGIKVTGNKEEFQVNFGKGLIVRYKSLLAAKKDITKYINNKVKKPEKEDSGLLTLLYKEYARSRVLSLEKEQLKIETIRLNKIIKLITCTSLFTTLILILILFSR